MDFTNIDTYCYLLIWFSIYSFLGWIYESVWVSINRKEFVNRGFLSGPVIPIYGFGALIFIILLRDFDNVVALFFAGAVLACMLEYFTSWSMEKIFHARWWDYSHYPLNLNGRICLYGGVLFGVFAVLIVRYIQPVLEKYTIYNKYTLYIVSIILLSMFLYDTVTTVRKAFNLSEKMKEVQERINEYKAARLALYKERGRAYEEQKARIIEGFKDELENSELYAGLRNMLDNMSNHEKRFFKAFPNLKSYDFSEGLEKIKDRINNRGRK